MRDLDAMRTAGTSISDRLKSAARDCGMDANALFKKFAIERLLVRLNASRHAGLYCLKGGMVMLLANPDMPRSTEDLDVTAFEPFAKDGIIAIFREVAATDPPEEDGIEFTLDEARAARDELHREEAGNPGFRLFVDGRMHTLSRPVPLRVKVDAAHSEAIVPNAVVRRLSPTIRGWEPPMVPVYPWETVLSEKIHAICQHGYGNTRLRDYYDILAIIRAQDVDPDGLSNAMAATFAIRGNAAPDPDCPGLGGRFAAARQKDWTALMAKRVFRHRIDDFGAVVAEVAAFARPALAAIQPRPPNP